jgi:hypothetical protein
VVHVYSADAIEVEFVTASGHAQALVTITTELVRPVGPKDILAVRQLDAAREPFLGNRMRTTWVAIPC